MVATAPCVGVVTSCAAEERGRRRIAARTKILMPVVVHRIPDLLYGGQVGVPDRALAFDGFPRRWPSSEWRRRGRERMTHWVRTSTRISPNFAVVLRLER